MSDTGLSFTKALISAMAKLPPPPDRLELPATVVSYDSGTNIATVRVVGDSAAIDVTSRIGALIADQRVMVAFDKPQGVGVVAVAP